MHVGPDQAQLDTSNVISIRALGGVSFQLAEMAEARNVLIRTGTCIVWLRKLKVYATVVDTLLGDVSF